MWKNSGIRFKIMFSVSVLTLFIISGLSSITYIISRNTVKEMAKEELDKIVDLSQKIVQNNYELIQKSKVKRKEIRDALLDIKIGETGYIFVIDSTGKILVHPFEDKEGVNIYNSKDKAGNYFVREMCEKKSGDIVYPWQNSGESHARYKIVKYRYVENIDWIVGAGVYEDELYAPIRLIRKVSLLLGISSIALMLLIVFLLINRITKSLIQVVENLNLSSEQVSIASIELDHSSQELAQGSSEQAASIEETSAILEETDSMVRHNTENTQKAASLVEKTKTAVFQGRDKMENMKTAMDGIKSSSDNISKIMKVIDDIAFQTNILALNAAVEAARAGEGGLGFAVVAEEVRELAQKSSQAAKDTADIIDESIKNSLNGVGLVDEVSESLYKIKDFAESVSGIMEEIKTASKEQSLGIGQINGAVAQMENVTQSIASTAEESASASEELRSQSESLNRVAVNLAEIVKGK